MRKQQNPVALKDQDTYVYIDASNIRWACQKTLDFRIDFVRMYDYLKKKYPNLQEVRYYEGIATGDAKKRRMFNFLNHKGYIICPLERKSYNSTETEEQEVGCPKCGKKWTTKLTREHKVMKSNVDVYLATELLTKAHKANKPIHIILVSCDGDYAEMIKNALENENVSISVLATPPVRDIKRNTLSVKLRTLRRGTPRYQLTNISSIAGIIKQK